MYFKPPTPNDDPSNPFFHPLNQKLNEEKQFKARVAFMGEPKDNARDMRAAGRMKMYDTATERNVPSKRKSTVFDITFKSERQFNQFMGAYDVEFLDRLDESRDDFDYLDAQAASEDRAIAGKKFMDALKKAGIKAEYVSSSGTMRVAKKDLRKAQGIGKKLKVDRDGVRMDVMREDVQLDEKKKSISTRLGDAFDSGELEDRIKSMSGPARKSFTNLANSLVDFYHTPKDIHQVDGRQLEDKIDGSPPRVRKMFAKLLDEEVTRLKVPHRVQKKKQTRKAKPIKDDVQIDEVTGETTVMAKSDRNQYERITRALTAANRTGKIKGYEGAHFNERTGMLTLIFDSKAHKPASERRKVAKMIKDFGLEFSHSVEEGFASDAQRRAAFASGYKAKGKKKKNEEEEVDEADINLPNKPKNAIKKPKIDSKQTVREGLRQAMSGPKETPAQRRKRQEKDNFDLYKKRQKRIAALRGDKSSRQLTPKQQRDYLKRVNLDQIKAMEETIMEGAKFSTAQLNMLKKEYGKIGKVDPSKPTYKKLTDMLDRMSDEQLMQIHKADIKFMSSLAANRLQSRGKLKESIDEEKGTYSSMGRRGIDKPLMAYIADLDKELKKMGMKYSDKKVNPDDVMKAYNANMSPKETAAMLKKKAK